MEACLEVFNVTDCLLQRIADMAAEHNQFDKPSIAVTSTIGLLALLFAVMTIFQAASGPGRRKCSHKAIGPWSRMTKRNSNWSELRRESLARTPVLTAEILLNQCKDVKVEIQEQDTANKYFPGSWLHLLELLGISDKVYKALQHSNTAMRCLADYLPDDVQAVPARMDIETIVALAVAAGCCRLQMDAEIGYPNLSGPRDIFKKLCGTEPSLMSLIREGRGQFLSREDGKFMDILGHREQWGLARHSDNRYEFKALDDDSFKMEFNPCQHEAPLLCNEPDLDREKLIRFFARSHNFLWLLYSHPTDPPKIFPAESVGLESILGAITAQGFFWSTSCSEWGDSWKTSLHLNPEQIKDLWHNYLAQGLVVLPGPGVLFLLCYSFAINPTQARQQFFRLDKGIRDMLRRDMLSEVQRIDKEVTEKEKSGSFGGQTLNCCRMNLYLQTAALLSLSSRREKFLARLSEPESEDHASPLKIPDDEFHVSWKMLATLTYPNAEVSEQIGIREMMELGKRSNPISGLRYEMFGSVIRALRQTGPLHYWLYSMRPDDTFKLGHDPIECLMSLNPFLQVTFFDPLREILIYLIEPCFWELLV